MNCPRCDAEVKGSYCTQCGSLVSQTPRRTQRLPERERTAAEQRQAGFEREQVAMQARERQPNIRAYDPPRNGSDQEPVMAEQWTRTKPRRRGKNKAARVIALILTCILLLFVVVGIAMHNIGQSLQASQPKQPPALVQPKPQQGQQKPPKQQQQQQPPQQQYSANDCPDKPVQIVNTMGDKTLVQVGSYQLVDNNGGPGATTIDDLPNGETGVSCQLGDIDPHVSLAGVNDTAIVVAEGTGNNGKAIAEVVVQQGGTTVTLNDFSKVNFLEIFDYVPDTGHLSQSDAVSFAKEVASQNLQRNNMPTPTITQK